MRTTLILLLTTITSLLHAQEPRIDFITPSIVRVQWAADGLYKGNNTGVCVYTPQQVKVKCKESQTSLTLSSSSLKVVYDKTSRSITFSDTKGRCLLHQCGPGLKAETVYQEHVTYDEASAHIEETANGKVTVRDILRRDTIGQSTRYSVSFRDASRALYGLGSHMEDYMNLVGKTLYLTQHNLKAFIPMLLSPDGYGLLFDAGCAMKFDGSDASQTSCGQQSPSSTDVLPNQYAMQLEAANELDYYFIQGARMDDVVAGYRYLTGSVSMMPRYVFGYTQSKERYTSSEDIINTLREYRRRHVPIDMIVQDWNYWPQGWGYMKMDPRFYPSPRALADSVHALNAKLMVSIWPNPQNCSEADDFKQRGFMLPNDVYDVFNPEARDLYWQYAYNEFFSQGFDAWWCDSSEPLDADWNHVPATTPEGKPYGWDSHAYRWQLNRDILSSSLGADRSSLYSLYHSKGIYEHQRATSTDKRVVNLTRSTYAGQQRFGTIVWNGDTHASWDSFRQQIPSGLNYMATGNPYWTVDVGCFFTNRGHRWFFAGEFNEGMRSEAYREFYVRMFQWATFLPILRSHGTNTPREIWHLGQPGTPYYDATLAMINFRYAHVPYIYSMAALQSQGNYTMARLLAFDFPQDANVLDIKDEYMFGAYLVCPVTRPLSESTTRRCYLPADALWIDYWTGTIYSGGQWVDLPCDIAQPPLFVRAGSIIPTTQVAEYTDAQAGLPITINVYPGQDASFTLYEDEGNNYNFEQGASSTIPLRWDDRKHTLTVGPRQGSFPGMQTTRTFTIKTPTSTTTVQYNGKKVTVTP